MESRKINATLLRVHLAFRWLIIIYVLLMLIFIPENLPRSRSFFWISLGVVILWNTLFFFTYHPRRQTVGIIKAFLLADLLISTSLVLVGGGWGNIFIIYSLSSVLLLSLEGGLTWSLSCATVLAGAFLASIWLLPGTISAVWALEGASAVVTWALSFYIVAAVALILKYSNERIEAMVDMAGVSLSRDAAIGERVTILAKINDEQLELLRQAKESIADGVGLARKGKGALIGFLRNLESGLRGAVNETREWLTRLRDSDLSLESVETLYPSGWYPKSILGRSDSRTSRFIAKWFPAREEERLYESVILFIIMTFRFLAISAALMLIIAGQSGITSTAKDYWLVLAVFVYNLVMIFVLRTERLHRPRLILPLDMIVTFLLLTGSGGWKTYFFIYAFSTGALGALWFGFTGAVLSGVLLGISYFGALYINGYTQAYLVHIGDSRNIFDSSFEYLLAVLTFFLIISVYRRSLYARRQLVTANAKSAVSEERLRLARDVHDGLVQTLASLAQRAGLLAERVSAGTSEDDAEQGLKDLREVMETAVIDARGNLEAEAPVAGPVDIMKLLEEAESVLNGDTRIKVHVENQIEEEITIVLPADLALVMRELFLNAERHSGAGNLSVRTSLQKQALFIEVRDDGEGFVPEDTLTSASGHGHFGLKGVQERISRMGGEVKITNVPGDCTVIVVKVPVIP